MPNLLIVGAQKAGTTWLHECLGKSGHVFASSPKELNFFNARDHLEKLPEYEAAFKAGRKARWRLESTPHYFRLPEEGLDIAARIHDLLGAEVRLLVMLRDPVERYLSSYTHHMMQGRLSYQAEITEMSDEYRMLGLGDYASILTHWQTVFPRIGVFFYDDLQENAVGLTERVMAHLGTPNDIPARDADFLTNAKSVKKDRTETSREWPSMPVLSEDLERRLAVYYRAEVRALAEWTGRDLSHWASLR
ncbi:sulfotransferase family protein [Pseudoponticoccus marisrubri]|uniref:sulfotransferase family protein n=1 Tax=Pseudoponticoccus marisrubri TaxID=1685382 RepID=UPI0012FE4348|nr:sulfotransferase [Pseudoponticoccus marisrubri]